VIAERGQPNVAPYVSALPHKAARLLEHFCRRGASVPVHTEPCTEDRLQQAAARGSHKSAKDDVEFVCEEMLEFCAQGLWTVLPLSVALCLPHLGLSPLCMVPQQNRRSWLIVDYSYSGVNNDTVQLSPHEAMQFGRALHRLMERIVYADPIYGPVLLGKIDIAADGFYRIGLRPHDVPRLGVILPTIIGKPLVALPLALPMGWVASPPQFTAVTETACDLLNATLRVSMTPSPHPLESLPATPPPDAAHRSWTPRLARMGLPGTRLLQLAYGDVFVDDFLLAPKPSANNNGCFR
jgi:hypothetical protein